MNFPEVEMRKLIRLIMAACMEKWSRPEWTALTRTPAYDKAPIIQRTGDEVV